MNKDRLQEARDFLEDLADNPPTLPYEPTLLPFLFAATREGSDATIDDLSGLIEHSQKLASKVLAVANSAVYALESKVTSVHRAVSILGFQEVRNIVVTVTAVSAIKGAKLPRQFNAIGLWRHQVRSAVMARILAAAVTEWNHRNGPHWGDSLSIAPDEAYAAALLHDIGKVFLAAIRPEIWASIEELREQKNLQVYQAEEEYWGMDHALIGAQVLHYWKLPLLLTDAINWHHAPHMAPAFKPEAHLMCAADLLAHKGLASDGALPEAVLRLLPPGLDGVTVGQYIHEALSPKAEDALAGLMD